MTTNAPNPTLKINQENLQTLAKGLVVVMDTRKHYFMEISRINVDDRIYFIVGVKKDEALPKWFSEFIFNELDSRFNVKCKKVTSPALVKNDRDLYSFDITTYKK